MKVGLSSNRTGDLIRGGGGWGGERADERQIQRMNEMEDKRDLPREVTARRQSSARQEESAHQKPNPAGL